MIELWGTLNGLPTSGKLVEVVEHGLDLLSGPQLHVIDRRGAGWETDDVLDRELARANQ